jgi:type 1 glutamine amidotransferase
MKHALIFQGGWDGHEPAACAALFEKELAARGFTVTVADTLECLDDPEALGRLDLIVPIWTMGTLAPEQEANLIAAVRGGTGLAGFHGGMGDAFRGAVGYQWMVGGQFVSHPDNIRDYIVRLVQRDDPILQGMPSELSVRSEQYYMLVDPANEVLATTVFECQDAPWVNGTVMPVVWKKRHGRGRVFYSALGHVCREFSEQPLQLEITLRGMAWASRPI